MKNNETRYSSANGEIWAMATFKVKYCHNIFNFSQVRKICEALLIQAMREYKIKYENIGFDENHVHILLEMGIKSKPDIAKLLKGFSGRKLLVIFPWLKKKYFWNSGLWSSAYDVRAHDKRSLSRYIDKQKYAHAGQQCLPAYAAA